MNYQESLNYIESTISRGIKLGLENVTRLLGYFGDPQLKVPTIHIAGTNGKGSTAAITTSILMATGKKVGLYTSPHLQDFRERIQVNRTLIPKEDLANLVSRIKHAGDTLGISPTYFELGTLLAFLFFYEQKVDWNVIEVGMGGRLDATNLCQAQVSVITSISKDHVSSLGSTLEEIAFEKAGIIKNPTKVIIGNIPPSPLAVIEEQARKSGAEIRVLGQDFKVTACEQTENGLIFSFSGLGKALDSIKTPLLGRFQAENAALAVAACVSALQPQGIIDDESIHLGLQKARWPGRLEIVHNRPKIILDCAHNLEGMKALGATLKEIFPDRKITLILGIMADKPFSEMIEFISYFAHYMIITRPNHDRSANPETLKKSFQKTGKPLEIREGLPSALRAALDRTDREDVICIAGSIFTVAEARQALEKIGFN